MNPPTESALKRSQKYRFSGTELNRISLRKERKKFIHVDGIDKINMHLIFTGVSHFHFFSYLVNITFIVLFDKFIWDILISYLLCLYCIFKGNLSKLFRTNLQNN